MSNAAFVLMNCDLIAVPLHLGCAGVVTVYCGLRRATQLLGDRDLETRGSLGSVARRVGAPGGAQTLPCKSSIARSVAPLQSR